MKKILLLFVIVFCAFKQVAAQEKITNKESALRTSLTNDAGITYNYDAAGNRIKRIYEGGGGCINTWTGNVSASWNNSGNWSLGAVPQPCHTVVIPALTTKPYPTLDVNTSISGISFTGGTINMNSFNIAMSFDSGCATSCP